MQKKNIRYFWKSRKKRWRNCQL